MIRTIDGFHQDEEGHWVAELSCLHGQHVRHQPPWQDRAWVQRPGGRAEHLGAPIECPLCDRAELPGGLVTVRTAGPFDATTLPAALQRDHRVADRTWGLLRVLEGRVVFHLHLDAGTRSIVVAAGEQQPIPPGVAHAVELTAERPTRLAVDFLVTG